MQQQHSVLPPLTLIPPQITQQPHSVLPPLTLIQPQESSANQPKSVSVATVSIDTTNTQTLQQFKQLKAHTNHAISQCSSKAHQNRNKIGVATPLFASQSVEIKERGGPLLKPQLSLLPPQLPTQLNKNASLAPSLDTFASLDQSLVPFESLAPLLDPFALLDSLLAPLTSLARSFAPVAVASMLLQPKPTFQPRSVENNRIFDKNNGEVGDLFSIANIDKERGGPLLQPQPSFQPKSVANFAGILQNYVLVMFICNTYK